MDKGAKKKLMWMVFFLAVVAMILFVVFAPAHIWQRSF
jgi:hypothetical protein